eukprot:1149963-Pelagomonas_calceolata.AAC.1
MPSVTSRAMPFAVHCYFNSEAKCPLDHACYACFGVRRKALPGIKAPHRALAQMEAVTADLLCVRHPPVSIAGWEVYKSKLDKEYPLGFPIIGNDATYRFSFELNIRDDESNLQKHEAAVADLISEGVDFIANAQPNFAMEEALQSNKANLINIHGVTSNTAVFERALVLWQHASCKLKGYKGYEGLAYSPRLWLSGSQAHRCLPVHSALPNVFGLAQPMERFFPEPMKAFKDANVDKVAIVYRGDLTELRVACKAAVQAAEAKGLSVQEISYTSSDPEVLDVCHTCASRMCHDQSAMPAFLCSAISILPACYPCLSMTEGVTRQVNLSSSTLGLVGCTLSAEAHQFLNKIHEMRKPLKGIMFTNGPANHVSYQAWTGSTVYHTQQLVLPEY